MLNYFFHRDLKQCMLEIALSLEGSILVHPGKIYRLVYLVLPGKSSMLAVLQTK